MKKALLLLFILFLLNSCKNNYSLEVNISPEYSGSVTPTGGVFEEGTEVTIIGTPSNGFIFKEYKGDFYDTSNPTTVKMNSNKSITVVFEENDSDEDGIMDNSDNCQDTPYGEIVDSNGCSSSQKDSDGDGIMDNIDQCPNTPITEAADQHGCSLSQKTYVPDDKFEQYLIDHRYDTELDDYVKTAAIENITSLELYNRGITDLTGIESFISLTELQCSNNQLSSIDLSNCTKLITLNCLNNELTNLDVSNCSELYLIDCRENELSSLDISNLSKLVTLNCSQNNLSSINISNCSDLRILHCNQNQLNALTINDSPSLLNLNCANNQLTNLDLNLCTQLEVLDCKQNRLNSFNISNCQLLNNLDCEQNQLTTIDIDDFHNLTHFIAAKTYS